MITTVLASLINIIHFCVYSNNRPIASYCTLLKMCASPRKKQHMWIVSLFTSHGESHHRSLVSRVVLYFVVVVVRVRALIEIETYSQSGRYIRILTLLKHTHTHSLASTHTPSLWGCCCLYRLLHTAVSAADRRIDKVLVWRGVVVTRSLARLLEFRVPLRWPTVWGWFWENWCAHWPLWGITVKILSSVSILYVIVAFGWGLTDSG